MRPAYVRYGTKVNPLVLGRKHCTGCGRWRLAVDFAAHHRTPKLTLASRCRACTRTYQAEVRNDPRREAARREYSRIWQERERRRRGQRTWQQWLADTGKSQPVLGRKHCTRCGCWRPVSDFGHRDGAMPAACMACLRQAARANAERVRNDVQAATLRREYQRIWHDAKRRAAGVKPRRLTRPVPPDPPRVNGRTPTHRHLATAPLIPHLEAWMAAYAAEHPLVSGRNGRTEHRGLGALAHAATVPERRLYGILVGESLKCHYATADRLAWAMDLPLTLIYGTEL